MAHKRIIREGHKAPDRTKLYAVVEKPTAGKDKGKITKTFEIDLSWDDAQRKKHWLAANRKTKFATVIPMPSEEEIERVLGTTIDAIAQTMVNAVADEDVDSDELVPVVDHVADEVAGSSLAGTWPRVKLTADAPAAVGHKYKPGVMSGFAVPACEEDCHACEADRQVIDNGLVCASDTIVDNALKNALPIPASSFNIDDGKVTPAGPSVVDELAKCTTCQKLLTAEEIQHGIEGDGHQGICCECQNKSVGAPSREERAATAAAALEP